MNITNEQFSQLDCDLQTRLDKNKVLNEENKSKESEPEENEPEDSLLKEISEEQTFTTFEILEQCLR